MIHLLNFVLASEAYTSRLRVPPFNIAKQKFNIFLRIGCCHFIAALCAAVTRGSPTGVKVNQTAESPRYSENLTFFPSFTLVMEKSGNSLPTHLFVIIPVQSSCLNVKV